MIKLIYDIKKQKSERIKKNQAEIHIGTSGWSYEHWKENFYPKLVKSANLLKYYSSVFSTVEINNTFYRMPKTTTVKKWQQNVPQDFLFSKVA